VALAAVAAQVMLTDGIASAYRAGRDRIAAAGGVREVVSTPCDGRSATPAV
jgi:NADP-dependent aldehyde dehydrogenase